MSLEAWRDAQERDSALADTRAMVSVKNAPRPSAEAIRFEHTIIACASGLIGRGEKMSDKDYDRLMLALDRVQDYL